ncbi:hypothetical protein YC2023_072055 [Brassica napus]
MSRRARRSLQNLGREPGRSGRRVGGNPSDSAYARTSKGDPVKIPEPGRRLTATLGSPETSAGIPERVIFSV